MKKLYLQLLALTFSLVSTSVYSAVISGTITSWDPFNANRSLTIGDGANSVTLEWGGLSALTNNWIDFVGSNSNGDTDVSDAVGITDISQITDASAFAFTIFSTSPLCDPSCDPDSTGDFVLFNNINTGHYAAARIDSVFWDEDFEFGFVNMAVDLTWWFQTDGSANLSAIPIPPAIWLFGSGLLGLIGVARKKAA